MKLLRPILPLCLTAAGLVLAFLYVGYEIERFRRPSRTLWSQVSIGDGLDSVRRILGNPAQEYTRDSAPEDYYISGYRRRERAISKRVLIYRGADLVFYVWFDENERVEELFVGGS